MSVRLEALLRSFRLACNGKHLTTLDRVPGLDQKPFHNRACCFIWHSHVYFHLHGFQNRHFLVGQESVTFFYQHFPYIGLDRRLNGHHIRLCR